MFNTMQAVLALLTTVNAGCVSVAMNQLTSSQPYGEGDVLFDQMAKNINTSYVLPEMLIDQFKSYVAILHVGSDYQLVTPIIDTTTSNTWLMSSKNPLCTGSEFDCTGKAFDDKSSSTSQKLSDDDWTVSYRDGTFATGLQIKDDITLKDGTKIKGAEFLLANVATTNGTILGLGLCDTMHPTKLSANGSYHKNLKARRDSDFRQKDGLNFPSHLKNQGLISRMAYSMFLDDIETNSGEILFGGVDHSKYEGEFGLLPIYSSEKRSISQPGLRVMLNGIGIRKGGQSCGILDFAMPFMLDSSTSYAIMPNEMVQQMADVIGFERRGVFYGGNCDGPFSFDTFELNFMGLKLQVPPKSLMVQEMDQYGYWRELDGKKQCYLAILATSDIRIAILGDIFMSNFYVVYDLESSQVAMAQAKFGSESPRVEEIKSSIPSASPVRFYAATVRKEITPLEYGTCFTTSTTSTAPVPSTTQIASESTVTSFPLVLDSAMTESAQFVPEFTQATVEPGPIVFKVSSRITAYFTSIASSTTLAGPMSSPTIVEPLHAFKFNNTLLELASENTTMILNDTVRTFPPVRFTAKPSFYGNGKLAPNATTSVTSYILNRTIISKHTKPTLETVPYVQNATQPILKTLTASVSKDNAFNETIAYSMSTLMAEKVLYNQTLAAPVLPALNASHVYDSSIGNISSPIIAVPVVANTSANFHHTFGATPYSTARYMRPGAPVLLNITIGYPKSQTKTAPNIRNVSDLGATPKPPILSATSIDTPASYAYNLSLYNASSSAFAFMNATSKTKEISYVYNGSFYATPKNGSTSVFLNKTLSAAANFSRAYNESIVANPVAKTSPVLLNLTSATLKSAPYIRNTSSSYKTATSSPYQAYLQNVTTSYAPSFTTVTPSVKNTVIAHNIPTVSLAAPTQNVSTPAASISTVASFAFVYNDTFESENLAVGNYSVLPEVDSDLLATISVPPGATAVEAVETAILEVPIDGGETTVHILTTIDVTHYVNYTVHIPRPTVPADATATPVAPAIPTTSLRTITKVPLSNLLPTPAATAPLSACGIPEDACIIYTVSQSTHFTTTLTVCDPEKVRSAASATSCFAAA